MLKNKCDCGGDSAEGLHSHWCDTNKPYRSPIGIPDDLLNYVGTDTQAIKIPSHKDRMYNLVEMYNRFSGCFVSPIHYGAKDAELTLRLIKALDHIPFDAKLLKDYKSE